MRIHASFVLLLVGGSLVASPSRAATRNWDNSAGGSFFTSSNWDPQSVPDSDDTARFDLGDQTYTVTFNGTNRSNVQLIVADDNVTFDLGGADYTATGGFLTLSMIIGETAGAAFLLTDSASLTVNDGTLTTGTSVELGADAVANTFPPPSHYLASGTLNIQGSSAVMQMTPDMTLHVGDEGRGTLNIMDGATLTSTQSGMTYDGIIGDHATAIGTANIDGSGSEWDELEELIVGRMGDGDLNVTGGGRISAERVFLAQEPGSTADVVVDSASSPIIPSRISTSKVLAVGGDDGTEGGSANLMIQNGGVVSSDDEIRIYDAGTVTLDGGRISFSELGLFPGAVFDWQAGRVEDYNNHSIVPQFTTPPLGDPVVVTSPRELEVNMTLFVTSDGTLNLEGGLVIARDFVFDGVFNWNSGTVQKTFDLFIAPEEQGVSDRPFGDNLTLGGDKHLSVIPTGAGLLTLFVGSSGGPGQLHMSNGASAGSNFVVLGPDMGSVGVVDLIDTGTTLSATRKLTVGDRADGTLIVNHGAVVTSQFAELGIAEGIAGEVTLLGTGALWQVLTDVANQTELPIGIEGAGTVSVGANSRFETLWQDVVLGQMSTGVGTVNVTGPNCEWLMLNVPADDLTIGLDGYGELNVQTGGSVTTGQADMAVSEDSTGIVNVDGDDGSGNPSIWHPTFLNVGRAGHAELHISNGGKVRTAELFAATDMATATPGDSLITVAGSGSKLMVDAPSDANIVLGVERTADLTVSNGGAVEAQGLFIGDGPDGVSLTEVRDADSTVDVDEMAVAYAGEGTLNVTDNALVTSTVGTIGALAGSDGTATIASGAAWMATDLYVGGVDGVAGGEGDLFINPGGIVTVSNRLTLWLQGSVHLNGGTLRADIIDHTHGGTFDFGAGTLHVDQFMGDLVNVGGVLAPGNTPGTTNVTGIYEQQTGASLEIELGGLDAGVDFDELIVDGTATLAGTLDLSYIDPFTAAPDDAFIVVDADTISGTFDAINYPDAQIWSADYDTNAGTLTVRVVCSATAPPDFDQDCDVDMEDVAAFEACASGPEVPLTGGCEEKDFDTDSDVDHADFAVVQRCFRGEDEPGDPACAD